MKKLLILLLTIPLLSFITDNKSKFVGKWIAVDHGDTMYIIFEKEGYVTLKMGGEVIGGKAFDLEGKKSKMTYSINDKTNPIQVDFIITELESNRKEYLPCLAKFIDDNTLKFAMGFEDEIRPTKFDADNSVLLKRKRYKQFTPLPYLYHKKKELTFNVLKNRNSFSTGYLTHKLFK